MTQYIYLASPMRLPKGSFGSKSVSPKKPNVFKNELDFTHLYFENNYDSKLKRRFSYSPHFSFNHQVAAYSNHIPLKYEIKGTAEEEKCLTILYFYLEEAIQASGIVEYFTCLSSKEELSISKKRNIRWKDIKDPYDLVLEDREFWEITL
ncbi:hypothetical protein RCG23_13795 [Neobacillus sp. PS3-34]|uniref:hypothetical protein n=1 Tax=Neobacillus sp. PS3-34 TaxID=3070678 RepID=UPI0027E074CE|nr:hypothetical protein [Neobacillus sp. PS3-34]WML46717.1 hypothetical protein RCG23_13795 [Neobacillus sp. PS3-34]